MSVKCLDDHLGKGIGLLPSAAYPSVSNDVSDLDLISASFYGSRDGFEEVQPINDTQYLLPFGEEPRLIRLITVVIMCVVWFIRDVMVRE